ncbi:hypothetical protein EDC18_10457 [Natranaerovirga pectinivora]|uniref:AB hydrolase-1 domain-containing protein n=1 Tax=Natranaerovirga pectinivora TaxID=682400 RepID=A0A4R3MKK1_9FIRM|nr:alpha/beta fold hydrolase [Natranaerovirga pectinivora]TCT14909.1 hypothetical protein EDC18_10457 [Natranaerovirga pectinivora]
METSVNIISNNKTLRGVLHTPDIQNSKYPIVMIFHGFGGNKMGPHFLFVKLSRLLEKYGIASIRFDFGGSGESDGEFIDMTLDSELEDARNVLDYVKSLEQIDPSKIGVLGFSMGGAIASLLAGENPNEIDRLTLWAPAGNIGEIVINNFIGKGYSDFVKDGYYNYEGLKFGKNFVENVTSTDVFNLASPYTKKVLLIHGNADEVVSLEASKKYLKIYGSSSELIIIEDADHLFSHHLWSDKVLEKTVDFFVET